MSAILKIYRTILRRHPYTIQSLQTGLLMATGNVLSQTIAEKKSIKHLDLTRTLHFFSLGVVFIGPACNAWYIILHKHFGKSGKTMALKKVAFDQLCFAPPCLFLCLVAINVLQGKSLEQNKEYLKTNYFKILAANYKLWPWVQIVNFYLVPVHYQLLVVQTVALLWNTYLAYETRPDQDD